MMKIKVSFDFQTDHTDQSKHEMVDPYFPSHLHEAGYFGLLNELNLQMSCMLITLIIVIKGSGGPLKDTIFFFFLT